MFQSEPDSVAERRSHSKFLYPKSLSATDDGSRERPCCRRPKTEGKGSRALKPRNVETVETVEMGKLHFFSCDRRSPQLLCNKNFATVKIHDWSVYRHLIKGFQFFDVFVSFSFWGNLLVFVSSVLPHKKIPESRRHLPTDLAS